MGYKPAAQHVGLLLTASDPFETDKLVARASLARPDLPFGLT